MRSALVLGATGLVGGHLVRQLVERPEYGRVVALVRRPTGLTHPKLEERVVDFDHLAPVKDAFWVDDLYCALGTTHRKAGSRAAFRRVDYNYPLAAACLGREAGVQRYLLVSSMGADPRSVFHYSRVKGELEAALTGLGLPSLQIFRPSLLLGHRQESRPGESVAALVMRLLDPVMVGPLARVRAVPAETVARAMIRVALQAPSGVRVYLNDEIHRIGGGA
jgi:uncharacterized protein YbjT (DUF2867 family)